MHSPTFVLILSTAPDENVAATLARGLIDNQLAACVNIIPGIRSFYRWQGQVHDDQEIQLLIKTRMERVDEVITWIKNHHPYEVPEVIALPIVAGEQNYLSWLHEQTGTL